MDESAKELVKVARGLLGKEATARSRCADYGDVKDYWNVFDWFKADGRRLEHDEVQWLSGMLEGALGRARPKLRAAIKKALLANKDDMADLERHGVQVIARY